MNSVPTAPPHDEIFSKLDSIVPNSDQDRQDEVPLDKDWGSIKHSLLNGDHTCPGIFWADDYSMPE